MFKSIANFAVGLVGIEFLRYLVAGSLSFVVDFSSLYLLVYYTKLHYLEAAAIAFCCGLVVAFAFNRYWVFDSKKTADPSREFMIFFVIAMVALGLNELAMWAFTELANLHYLISKIAVVAMLVIFQFFARKAFIYDKSAPAEEAVATHMDSGQAGFNPIQGTILISCSAIILFAVITALLSSQEVARNARRVSDVEQLQKAMRLYRQEYGIYPKANSGVAVGADNTFSRFLAEWPSPPKGTGCTGQNAEYFYEQLDDGRSYTIRFCLESDYGNLKQGVRVVNQDGGIK